MPSLFERHWWSIAVGLLACLLLIVRHVPPDRLPTSPRTTWENCWENSKRIKPGMTLKQIEEILGPAPAQTYWHASPGGYKPTPDFDKCWQYRDGDCVYSISVSFD